MDSLPHYRLREDWETFVTSAPDHLFAKEMKRLDLYGWNLNSDNSQTIQYLKRMILVAFSFPSNREAFPQALVDQIVDVIREELFHLYATRRDY